MRDEPNDEELEPTELPTTATEADSNSPAEQIGPTARWSIAI